MNWYIEVLKKYAVFDGRASRTEFWMFTLVNFIVMVVLQLLDLVVGLGFLTPIYALAVFLPTLGVMIRRLHDIGRSGWWVLVGLIPIVGFIVLLVFAVQESQPGSNQFGPGPQPATV